MRAEGSCSVLVLPSLLKDARPRLLPVFVRSSSSGSMRVRTASRPKLQRPEQQVQQAAVGSLRQQQERQRQAGSQR